MFGWVPKEMTALGTHKNGTQLFHHTLTHSKLSPQVYTQDNWLIPRCYQIKQKKVQGGVVVFFNMVIF